MIVGGLGIGGIDSVGVCPVCVTGSLSPFLFSAINDTLFLKKIVGHQYNYTKYIKFMQNLAWHVSACFTYSNSESGLRFSRV